MTVAGTGGAAAAGAAAAIAQAIKASGAIVRVKPDDFQRILDRQREALVIHAPGGFFGSSHQYLTSYKGLTFFTKTKGRLPLPGDSELIESDKIWIPG